MLKIRPRQLSENKTPINMNNINYNPDGIQYIDNLYVSNIPTII